MPRRMINLAVGAYDRRKITLDELSEVLGTDRRGARQLLRAYQLPTRRPPEREA
jgi:predicted HTH domain antitoxin